MLLQDPDDLLFRIPALLHTKSSRLHYERTPATTGRVFWGQVIGKEIDCDETATTIAAAFLPEKEYEKEFLPMGPTCQ
jgi:hypothetical protein